MYKNHSPNTMQFHTYLCTFLTNRWQHKRDRFRFTFFSQVRRQVPVVPCLCRQWPQPQQGQLMTRQQCCRHNGRKSVTRCTRWWLPMNRISSTNFSGRLKSYENFSEERTKMLQIRFVFYGVSHRMMDLVPNQQCPLLTVGLWATCDHRW